MHTPRTCVQAPTFFVLCPLFASRGAYACFSQGDYAWNRTDQPLPDNVKRTVCWAEVDAELEALLQSSGGGGSSGGGASNGTELEDSSHLVAGPSTSPAAAAVAAVVSGAATTAATGATENGEVGVAPPSNVVGEDVVTCAA